MYVGWTDAEWRDYRPSRRSRRRRRRQRLPSVVRGFVNEHTERVSDFVRVCMLK